MVAFSLGFKKVVTFLIPSKWRSTWNWKIDGLWYFHRSFISVYRGWNPWWVCPPRESCSSSCCWRILHNFFQQRLLSRWISPLRVCCFALLGKAHRRRWSRLEKPQSTWVAGELGGWGSFSLPVNILRGGNGFAVWVADGIRSYWTPVGTGRMSWFCGSCCLGELVWGFRLSKCMLLYFLLSVENRLGFSCS